MAERSFLDQLLASGYGLGKAAFGWPGVGQVEQALDPQPTVTNRASMLPIGNYSDGSVGFAWPQSSIDAKEAFGRFGRGEPPQPQDAVLAGLAMAGTGFGGLGSRAAARSGSVAGAERAGASGGFPSSPVAAGRVFSNPPNAAPVGALTFEQRLSAMRAAIDQQDPALAQSWRSDPRPQRFDVNTPFEHVGQGQSYRSAPDGGQQVMVDLAKLKTQQPGVSGYAVKDIAERGADPNLLPQQPSNGALPKVARLDDGSYLVLGGNHRLAAQALKGETQALVMDVGLPSHIGEAGRLAPEVSVLEEVRPGQGFGSRNPNPADTLARARQSQFWPEWGNEYPERAMYSTLEQEAKAPWSAAVNDILRTDPAMERWQAEAAVMQTRPELGFAYQDARRAWKEHEKGRPLSPGEEWWDDLHAVPGTAPDNSGLADLMKQKFMVAGHPELERKHLAKQQSALPRLPKPDDDTLFSNPKEGGLAGWVASMMGRKETPLAGGLPSHIVEGERPTSFVSDGAGGVRAAPAPSAPFYTAPQVAETAPAVRTPPVRRGEHGNIALQEVTSPDADGAQFTIIRDGEEIGKALVKNRDGAAYISDIGVNGGPNALGVSGLRSLREAFRQIDPNVTDFQGHRVSGARTGPAAVKDASTKQKVTLFSNPSSPTGLLPMAGGGEEAQPDFIEQLLRKYGYLPQ